MVPLAIVSGLLTWRFFGNYMRAIELLMNEPPGPDFNLFPFLFDTFGRFYGGLLLLILLSVAAQAIVILSLTVQCIEALHGGSMTLAAGIRRGLRRFWPYVGMMIVQWAAIFAATAAVIIPFGGGLLALVIGGGLLGSNFLGYRRSPRHHILNRHRSGINLWIHVHAHRQPGPRSSTCRRAGWWPRPR